MLFIWPIIGVVSRDFYYRASIYIGGQHMAVDIPANSGTLIKAVAAGKVIDVGYSDINGNYVVISHAGGWRTKYRHLVKPAVVGVDAGVSQGQAIGKVGSTGWSTGPHLHFDLWNSSKQSPEAVYKSGIWAHDPELYLGMEEEREMTKFIQYKTAIAVLEGGVKWTLPSGSLLMKLYPEHQGNVIQLTEAEWKSIPNAHGPSGDSGGATPDQFVDKLKERL